MKLIYAMALATIAGASQAAEIPSTGYDHFNGIHRYKKSVVGGTTPEVDDTGTSVARVTYDDGRQEDCTVRMIGDQNNPSGIYVSPTRLSCTPASSTN